jgi:hypothetical protein
MRFRLALFVLGFALALGVSAAEIAIVRVWPSYRTADSFERISEYFGGSENSSRRTVLRTQAGERAGYYFLVRVANSGPAQAGCTWQLQVILPTAAQPHVLTFKTDFPAGKRVYELGLTGSDWPNAHAEPVAWKLVLLAADGHELVSQQSFLWDRPPAPAK